MMEDHALLREYAEHRSERAFAELVARYVDLVYSAARRVVGETHLAQDVAQSVFILLARKAGGLPKEVVLGVWLHRHTYYAACNTLRAERRQREHANHAMELNTLVPDTDAMWQQLAPLLDEAMSHLGRPDHEAVLLRFFQGKSLREVGQALGLSDDAAQKRVSRAIEKLRTYFNRRGITASSAMVGSALAAHAVQAAPAALASTIVTGSAAAMSATAATGLTLTLLEILAMTKVKTASVVVILVAAVSIPLVLEYQANHRLRSELRAVQQQRQINTIAPTTRPAVPLPQSKLGAPPAKVFDWKTVESTDYRTYVANLRAIGCPEQTIRDIIRADVKQLYDERIRAQMPQQRFEYWKPGASIFSLVNDDFVNRQKDLAVEKHLLLKELLGTDASLEPDLSPGLHLFESVLDFTTAEKRSQVMEVELLNIGRLVAAQDQNSFAKAQAEKDQFLSTILTPQEKFEYDVRLSPTALSIQGRLGEFTPTEQEFRELVQLQKKFDDANALISQSGSSNDATERRAAAQKELENQARNLLGDDRYRQYLNEQNWAGSSLRQVAQEYNIPKETAFKVFDLTDTAKQAADSIRLDAHRSDAQKQAALDAIRAETETAVNTIIGPQALQAYINRGTAIKKLNQLR